MSYFPTERCRLYYEDTAETDPSALARPAVLFVNGWAISARYWKPLVDLLKADYRCVTYDQSGTGRTHIEGHRPSLTIEGFADEAGALVEHLGLDRKRNLHIVGHSMGGMVATELALRYRDALLSATIIACGIFEENLFNSIGLFMLGGLIDVSMHFRSIFQAEPMKALFIKRATAKEIGKEYSDIIAGDFISSDREATTAVGKFSIDPEALRAYTRHVIEIPAPVLCSVGMADHTIPPEGTITLYETRKKKAAAPTSLLKFDDLGHLPMLEDTVAFAEGLKKHFESSPDFFKSATDTTR